MKKKKRGPGLPNISFHRIAAGSPAVMEAVRMGLDTVSDCSSYANVSEEQ